MNTTVTVLKRPNNNEELVRAVEIVDPPSGYHLTVNQVLELDDDVIIYEICLARLRMKQYCDHVQDATFYVRVIDWLCMMRPSVMTNKMTWRRVSNRMFE